MRSSDGDFPTFVNQDHKLFEAVDDAGRYTAELCSLFYSLLQFGGSQVIPRGTRNTVALTF